MKLKDIREFSVEDAKIKLRELKEELLNLRVRKQCNSIQKPHQFQSIRRNIARIETILRQKSLNNA